MPPPERGKGLELMLKVDELTAFIPVERCSRPSRVIPRILADARRPSTGDCVKSARRVVRSDLWLGASNRRCCEHDRKGIRTTGQRDEWTQGPMHSLQPRKSMSRSCRESACVPIPTGRAAVAMKALPFRKGQTGRRRDRVGMARSGPMPRPKLREARGCVPRGPAPPASKTKLHLVRDDADPAQGWCRRRTL